MNRRALLILALAALTVGFVGRTLIYYRGVYSGPELPTSEAERFEVRSEPLRPAQPVEPRVRRVLIDRAHRNNFDEQELSILFGRIAAAGGRVEMLRSGANLEAQLRSAGSFVVIANQRAFGADQVQIIEGFVRKGGRLLLVGDPTRLEQVNSINSLAGAFGITYQDDYLYNLVENDGNYLNVILRDFEASPLSEGVQEIVLQTAHSLRAREGGIVLGDANTYSSQREQPGDVIAAALTSEERVLALTDLTSLTGPYNTFADNDRFIDNVVRFLLTSPRSFDLVDFPHFFRASTGLVYADSQLLDATFEHTTRLRRVLSAEGIETELRGEYDVGQSLLYVGLYDQLDRALHSQLRAAGVVISDEPLQTETGSGTSGEGGGASQGRVVISGVGSLERGGTVLFHLNRAEDGPYQLYLLAADAEVLSRGLDLLLDGRLADCSLSDVTALCTLAELEAAAEGAQGEPTGALELLVVSDDAGSLGPFGLTSAGLIRDSLAADFSVTTASTASEGDPSADELQGFSAVFWSTGDYCCLSPSPGAADALMQFLDSGGALFISGANLGGDWAASPFFADYLGALDIGDAPVVDLRSDAHTISTRFDERFALLPGSESVLVDVIDTDLAGIAFRRGSNSEFTGQPAVIAYDRGGSRVVYSAFPLFLLGEDHLDLLLQNALAWLLAGG